MATFLEVFKSCLASDLMYLFTEELHLSDCGINDLFFLSLPQTFLRESKEKNVIKTVNRWFVGNLWVQQIWLSRLSAVVFV